MHGAWWPLALLCLLPLAAAKEPPMGEDGSYLSPDLWLDVCIGERGADWCRGGGVGFAEIRLVGPDGMVRTVVADAYGTAQAYELPPGEYTVAASHAGFRPREAVTWVPGSVSLALEPEIVLARGTLVDADGPRSGMLVEFSDPYGQGQQALTGPAGVFEVELLAGNYRATVGDRTGEVFLDGSDFTLDLAGDRTIHGRVLGPDGPVAGAQISSWTYEDAPPEEPRTRFPLGNAGTWVVTASDGSFALSVGPGSTHIDANADGFYGAAADVPAGQDKVEIQLEPRPLPTAPLTVRAVDAVSEDPIPGIDVSIEYPIRGEYVCTRQPAWGASYEAFEEVFVVFGDAPMKGPPPVPESDPTSSYMVPTHVPRPILVDDGCLLDPLDDGVGGTVFAGYAIVTVSLRCCDAVAGYHNHVQSLEIPADGLDLVVRIDPIATGGATLIGTLHGQDGAPASYAEVTLSTPYGYNQASASADERGRFRLESSPGHVEASVWAPGFAPWRATMNLKEGENVVDITLARQGDGFMPTHEGPWSPADATGLAERSGAKQQAGAGSDAASRPASGESALLVGAPVLDWLPIALVGAAALAGIGLGIAEMRRQK